MNTCKENNQKNLDEAIANAANASKAICVINSHFAQLGIPMLVMSNVHKLMGEKGKKYLGINSDDLALLNAISMREALQVPQQRPSCRQVLRFSSNRQTAPSGNPPSCA